MAYFKKGHGLIKVSYKSNFEMRSLNVNFKAGGYSFTPQLYGVDGLSSVNIVDESLGKAMITAPLDVISIDLPPEYENVGSKAFLACSNLESVYVYAGKVITIADDAFPANCVVYVDNEFLTEYQTEHPLLDIRGFDSGYVYEIPYQDGLTPTTLAAQYVNDLFDGMTLDRKTKIGKVVVPVYFTAYESGALDAVFNKTPNLEAFASPWLNGNVNDGLEWTIPAGGSTTLAAVYVQSKMTENCIKDYAVKVIVPAYFTGYETKVFNSLDSLSNDFGVEVSFVIRNYRTPCYTGSKMKTLWYKGVLDSDGIEQMNSIETLYVNGATGTGVYNIWSCAKLKNIYLNTITAIANNSIGGNGMQSLQNIYAPVTQTIARLSTAYSNPNLWLGRDDCSLSNAIKAKNIYVPATSVGTYMVATKNWIDYANKFIGIIDGASIYQNMEGEQGVSMNYPTLSATLTIDSNGHLIENGTDLFTGYTATWYSDEDCTTVIADPTTIAATDTAYVKLTAI